MNGTASNEAARDDGDRVPLESEAASAGDADRLSELFRARHPAVSIVTSEEAEALELVRTVAAWGGHQLWIWSALDGVRDDRKPNEAAVKDTADPATGLYWLAMRQLPSIIVLLDAGEHLEDPLTRRALRELIAGAEQAGSNVVLIDHTQSLPPAIGAHATPFELSLPDDDRIERLVRTTLKALHRESPIEIEVSAKDYRTIVKNLRGLTGRQTRQVIRDVVAEDRRFSSDDLNGVLARKRQMIGADGALEYVESPSSLDDVGGLRTLKKWLRTRERSFSERAGRYGLAPPRGVLMLGVQGAGKSLCAKAIATGWGRPLLRLDPGTLYDRYVGESERRLRDALRQAEAMAPIVLWIDEIEKGFASAASQSTDGGLSQRMFGTLLTWMQDHREPVFLIATANNIDALPPELLRKGRFDEIFFVDLPREEARAAIFEIHLRRRGRDPSGFDLPRLARESEGFSGSEIEQAVVSALHEAFASDREPDTELIAEQVRTSPPLSVTMAESIERLRRWAASRCVPAD